MLSEQKIKYFIYSIIGVVAIAVVAGFFVVGSPTQERIRKIDARRVNDLQLLQGEIVNYWQNKGELPQALGDLRDDIRGVTIPRDPETGAEYGYSVGAPETFTLCATFMRESTVGMSKMTRPYPVEPYGYLSENWEHGAGQACFERTIDPDIYRLREGKVML